MLTLDKSGPKLTRVLVIGLYNSRGGIETSTMNYYRNFDHNKIQYDFVNPYKDFYYRDEITELGGRIYDVNNFKNHPIKYMVDIYKVIRGNHYSVVSLPMLSAINPLALIVSKVAGAKTIVHSHSSMTNGLKKIVLHSLLKPIVNALADYRWACSLEAGRWMYYGDFEVVNNAININDFSFDSTARQIIRDEFELGDKYIIGNVGRFAIEKNQSFLIDILAKVRERNKDAILFLVGSGNCIQDVKDKAESMGLAEKVIFAGERDDVGRLYSAMDVFVLPSLFEGLGMVGIEAQAAGLQVVCTDSITNEMNVSGRTKYIGLSAPIERWVSAIARAGRTDSKTSHTALTKKGYDIKIEALRLERLYVSICKDGNDGK